MLILDMANKKTLVIGASEDPSRYANMAVRRLLMHQQPVVAIGNQPGQVEGIYIDTLRPDYDGVDTVTLYIRPQIQKEYYDYILGLHPKRIIFNPGTENPELIELAKKNNIEPIIACTLVMLSTGQF